MKVIYSKPLKSRLKIARREITSLVRSILDLTGITLAGNQTVGVHFTDVRMIEEINHDYVGHSGITDVISFDYRVGPMEDDDIVAEIFVCVDKAQIEAGKRRNVTFESELVLYILHGFLHIAGFDDLDPADRKRMRLAERSIMKKLASEFRFDIIFQSNR